MWRIPFVPITLGAMKPGRGVIMAVLLLLALVACQGQQPPPPADDSEGVFGTAGPGSSVSASPTASGAPGDAGTEPAPQTTLVRAEGFLRSEDMGNGTVEILPSSRVSEARINPCGGGLPSDSARLARAAAQMVFQFNGQEGSTPDGTGYEVIARYRTGGASAYLADLRDAVGSCATETTGTSTEERQIGDTGFAGDESVLVTYTSTYEFQGQQRTSVSMTAALRLGELVIIIDVAGWEGADLERSDLDRLVAAAIVRAAAA
jgi:hypothetical protein